MSQSPSSESKLKWVDGLSNFNFSFPLVSLVTLILYNQTVAVYQRAIPFYDSLLYQDFAFNIIKNSPAATYQTSQLYQYFFHLIRPLVTAQQTALAVYMCFIMLVSTQIVYHTVRRLTGQASLAFIASILIVAVPPMRLTVGGFVDQRLDFSGCFTYMILLSALFSWFFEQTRPGAFLIGVAFSVAVLHRFILLAQFGPVTCAFAVTALLDRERPKSEKLIQLAIALATIVATFSFCYLPKIHEVLVYYTGGYDVFKVSFFESARFYFSELFSYVSVPIFALVAVLFLLQLRYRDVSKQGLLLMFAILSPMIVPVATRSSDNGLVLLPTLGAIPFLAMVAPAARNRLLSFVYCMIALALVCGIITNLHALKKAVENTAFEKPVAQLMLQQIESDRLAHGNSKIVISGFACRNVCAGSLVSIARFDSTFEAVSGFGYYHWTELKFPTGDRNAWTTALIRERIRAALDSIARVGGYVLVNDDRAPITNYIASGYLMPIIVSEISADSRFEKTRIAAHVAGETINVFRVK